MPAALHSLLPWRAWDESSELYVNAGSVGFAVELPPFAGIDAETLGALSGTLADAAPERCTVQVIHWASPRFGAAGARLGRAPQGCGRRAGPDGCAPPRPVRFRGLAAAACGRSALHPLGLPGVRHRLPHGPARPGRGDRARRVPPGAGGHAGVCRSADPPAGAGRAAVIGRRAGRPGSWRLPRRRNRTPAAALGAARSPPRTVHRPRPRAHGPSDRPRLPSPRRGPRRGPRRRLRRYRRAGSQRHRLPGGLARLARQRADRRLPPRLHATRLPGADLPYRGHGRRGRRREGVSQIRPRHPAGRNRPRQIPAGAAREGARLAGGDGADQGRREAGPGLLHGGGLRPVGRAGRGRAGGARHLSRPGLAGERRALHAAALLAGLPAHGVRRRPRSRPRTHGPDEDAAHLVGGQSRAVARRVAGAAHEPRQSARSLPHRPARPARLLVALRQRGRQLQRGGHRQVGLRQVGADAGAGDGADRRRRRGRGDRRRALVPAHRGGIGRRLHRLRQGPGLPQPLRHDRRRDRRARRRLQGRVLRHARRRHRPHGAAKGRNRRYRGGADRRGHCRCLGRGRQRCRSRIGTEEPRSPLRPARRRHGNFARPLVPGRGDGPALFRLERPRPGERSDGVRARRAQGARRRPGRRADAGGLPRDPAHVSRPPDQGRRRSSSTRPGTCSPARTRRRSSKAPRDAPGSIAARS